MKKILLASSALVAFGFAASAQAAEPVKLSVGGFMKQYFGYADVTDNDVAVAGNGAKFSKTDMQSDTEVHFKGSTKLDNGLTVAVRVELEGANNASSNAATQIDEEVLTVSGAFGQVLVGGEDNTGYLLHSSAPDVGIGNNDGDITNWIPAPANFVAVSGNEMVDAFTDDGDAEKISYISPSVMGFQVGGSYTPDVGVTNDTTLAPAGRDAWVGTVAYNNKFNDIDVKADFSYFGMNGNFNSTTGAATVDGNQGWQAGMNIGYAGFVVGGGYINREDDSRNTALVSREGNAWTAGVAYKTGPYGVSLGYGQSEAEGTQGVTGNGEDKLTQWIASGSYAMGPGIDLKASVFNVKFEDETNSADNNREGWGAVTGVAVAF